MTETEPLTFRASGAVAGASVALVAVEGVSATAGQEGLLSYSLPAEIDDAIAAGDCVWVPVRKRYARGVVVRLGERGTEFTGTLRPILGLIQPRWRIDEDRLAVGMRLARQTVSSLFSALELFLPPGYGKDAPEMIRLADPGRAYDDLTPTQRQVVELLRERAALSTASLRKLTGRPLTSVVSDLVDRGIVVRFPGDPPPSEESPGEERYVRLTDKAGPEAHWRRDLRALRQIAVLDYLHRQRRLRTVGDGVRAAEVQRTTGADRRTLTALAERGYVEIIERASPPAASPQEVMPSAAPRLTGEQVAAWQRVEQGLVERDSTPVLLFGVTGSGKTEIYLRAIAWCLRQGRSSIVLVPEISLATQLVRRVRARFPGQVAVLHSALPASERSATWKAVAEGRLRVVVGPRSALFAPAREVGLIVLDEEHESAYKQETEPRYHARTVAEALARRLGAAVVLGSATPSIETSYRAERGEIDRVVLSRRVGQTRHGDAGGEVAIALPPVEVVDQRLELHRGNTGLLSQRLEELVAETLERREQAILLLNRRGSATVVLCRECGARLVCPHCDIPLIYHQDRQQLICHRCDYRERLATVCPICGGPLNYFGAGTQKVEQAVRERFPGARVLRWDQDTARRRGGPEAMLQAVEPREVDIIVGTQMIAKGFDLPHVATVGVINADAMLHLPDFRSAERTFQLLTQVAGRAGRRGTSGRVVIQSFTPQHYAIAAASRHDYGAFYAEEIAFREQQLYPPFSRLVRFLYRHRIEASCATEAAEMAHLLARHVRQRGQVGVADVLGPAPAFAARVRDEYQWNVVLRSPALDELIDGLPTRPGWVVDVDPMSML